MIVLLICKPPDFKVIQMIRHSLLLTAALLLSACSANKIIIDREGVNEDRYQQDLASCQQYAEEVQTGKKVAGGAVGGALIGGAIGAILGDSRSAARAAGAGSVTGAAGGASRAAQEKTRVVKNCLRGRGYQVLN